MPGELGEAVKAKFPDYIKRFPGDSGCDGGFAQYALEYIMQNGGIAFENVYPYLMQDGWCEDTPMSGVTVKG